MTLIIDGKEFDFVDFGASKGGSIEVGIRRLGGRRGLGIDLKDAKIAVMKEKGYDCIQGDVTNLDLPDKCVRFVIMSHLLEHLPDLDAVRKTIKEAARIATDFIFLRIPYFDTDEYLESLGLKFFWSHWRGHPCRLKSWELREIFEDLGLADHEIMGGFPILGSDDPSLHPLASPIDQFEYDPEKHPPKPEVGIEKPLFRELVSIVMLKKFKGWEQVLEKVDAMYGARTKSAE